MLPRNYLFNNACSSVYNKSAITGFAKVTGKCFGYSEENLKALTYK